MLKSRSVLEFGIVLENYFYFIFDSTKTYVRRTYARRARAEKRLEKIREDKGRLNELVEKLNCGLSTLQLHI